jgi:hypothetical protein
MIVNYKDSGGVDCIIVTNEDGSTWSGLKSAYDEMIARNEAASL